MNLNSQIFVGNVIAKLVETKPSCCCLRSTVFPGNTYKSFFVDHTLIDIKFNTPTNNRKTKKRLHSVKIDSACVLRAIENSGIGSNLSSITVDAEVTPAAFNRIYIELNKMAPSLVNENKPVIVTSLITKSPTGSVCKWQRVALNKSLVRMLLVQIDGRDANKLSQAKQKKAAAGMYHDVCELNETVERKTYCALKLKEVRS